MIVQPSTRELVEAVKAFIERDAIPQLQGATAFHARVAANALATVVRELELGAKAEEREAAGLAALLGGTGTLEELNRALCAALRAGTMDIDDPALRAHLEATTRDKLAIDQPSYSGLRTSRS